MLKGIFKNIASLFMSLIVLASTMSFTVDTHYCGDILVDSSMINPAESCDMDLHLANSTKNNNVENNCCKNQKTTITGQKELNISFDNFSIDQQIFVVSFAYSYLNLFEGLEYKGSSFLNYPPPLIVKNIYKLDEVYLI